MNYRDYLYMNYRDYLQQLIYKIINPVVHGMIKVGITPNFITTTGLVLNIVAGLFDMMDGRVARVGNMSSTFGALYDSVLDRYSELFTLFGILYFLLLQGYFWGSIITGVAIIGSLMVSYVRARAEGLDLECKVGLMQRPERVVLTALGAIFCGVFQDCTAFDSVYILIAPLAIIAVLANWTAFVRINHCRKLLKK